MGPQANSPTRREPSPFGEEPPKLVERTSEAGDTCGFSRAIREFQAVPACAGDLQLQDVATVLPHTLVLDLRDRVRERAAAPEARPRQDPDRRHVVIMPTMVSTIGIAIPATSVRTTVQRPQFAASFAIGKESMKDRFGWASRW